MYRLLFFLSIITLSIAYTDSASATTCIEFHPADKVANIADNDIAESSGLAVSTQHTDLLWTHNDSGDSARFFALTQSGESRGTINLSGASAQDWEAMAIGPCNDTTCLVIADVGDNNSVRDDVSLWRLVEPTPTGQGTSQILTAQEMQVVYPDGAQDCEGIAIDPLTGDVILVEKSMTSKARVHRLPSAAWDSSSTEPTLLEKITRIDFETDSLTGGLITGVDISPSGMELFVRTYIAGFHVPITRDDNGIIHGFEAVRQVSVYDDGQCEAVAYDGSGLELWFTCEDENGPIARAECKTSQDDETGDTTTTEQGGCDCGGVQAPWLALLCLGLWARKRRHPHGLTS